MRLIPILYYIFMFSSLGYFTCSEKQSIENAKKIAENEYSNDSLGQVDLMDTLHTFDGSDSIIYDEDQSNSTENENVYSDEEYDNYYIDSAYAQKINIPNDSTLHKLKDEGPVLSNYSDKKWEELSQATNYIEEREKEIHKEKVEGKNPLELFLYFRKILIGLFILLCLFIVFLLIRKMNFGKTKDAVLPNSVNTTMQMEHKHYEAELDRAIAAGDYKLALHYFYRNVLNHLLTQGTLKWSAEKTNRDYLKELKSMPIYIAFQFLTAQFEKYWYGHQIPDKEKYESIVENFKLLMHK